MTTAQSDTMYDMSAKSSHLQPAVDIITYLQANSINPILYGSLGVSIYLGPFKAFNDIDLLVDGQWTGRKWPDLVAIMQQKGFKVVDEHEHEFRHQDGRTVAFAEEAVLTRDGILTDLDEVVTREVAGGMQVRTLSPEAFRAAYLFSEKDGYRKNTRGKKDRDVISLLDQYLGLSANN